MPRSPVVISERGPDCLAEYARISIAFRVESVYRVDETIDGIGFALHEVPVDEPYIKDYDAIEKRGQRIPEWAERFDVTNWRFLLAMDGDCPVGGAIVLCDSPEIYLLGGRRDLGLLWDIRVKPELRRDGIGSALWDHATDWARRRKCTQFKVETSNVNVPACRFYRKMGCTLGGIDRYAYRGCPETAHEAMLLWYMAL